MSVLCCSDLGSGALFGTEGGVATAVVVCGGVLVPDPDPGRSTGNSSKGDLEGGAFGD